MTLSISERFGLHEPSFEDEHAQVDALAARLRDPEEVALDMGLAWQRRRPEFDDEPTRPLDKSRASCLWPSCKEGHCQRGCGKSPVDDSAYEQFADTAVTSDNQAMSAVWRYAAELRRVEEELAELDERKKMLEAQRESLRAEALPQLLQEMGVEEVMGADGKKLRIKRSVFASMPKDPDSIETSINWLEKQGGGDLVKTQVLASFGRGERNKAKSFANYCRGYVSNVEERATVHPQTLSKFIRDLRAEGISPPKDTISVHEKTVVEIK